MTLCLHTMYQKHNSLHALQSHSTYTFAKQVCCWSRFMRSHTVGHQSILDPTGSLPVYPSQATLVKDWSFGLATGTASAELIAKYQQLNPDVEPNQILLPRRLRYRCCLCLCTMLPVFVYYAACVCIQYHMGQAVRMVLCSVQIVLRP